MPEMTVFSSTSTSTSADRGSFRRHPIRAQQTPPAVTASATEVRATQLIDQALAKTTLDEQPVTIAAGMGVNFVVTMLPLLFKNLQLDAKDRGAWQRFSARCAEIIGEALKGVPLPGVQEDAKAAFLLDLTQGYMARVQSATQASGAHDAASKAASAMVQKLASKEFFSHFLSGLGEAAAGRLKGLATFGYDQQSARYVITPEVGEFWSDLCLEIVSLEFNEANGKEGNIKRLTDLLVKEGLMNDTFVARLGAKLATTFYSALQALADEQIDPYLVTPAAPKAPATTASATAAATPKPAAAAAASKDGFGRDVGIQLTALKDNLFKAAYNAIVSYLGIESLLTPDYDKFIDVFLQYTLDSLRRKVDHFFPDPQNYAPQYSDEDLAPYAAAMPGITGELKAAKRAFDPRDKKGLKPGHRKIVADFARAEDCFKLWLLRQPLRPQYQPVREWERPFIDRLNQLRAQAMQPTFATDDAFLAALGRLQAKGEAAAKATLSGFMPS